MVAGRVAQLTVWPVKSLSGGTHVEAVHADRSGLAGDRTRAFVDRRPLRAGHVVSARNVPGLLRWSARYADGALDEPVLTAPDGRRWSWDDDGLAEVVSDDVGVPLALADPGRYWDLADSVLLTTSATHDAVVAQYGRPLEQARWRTNLHVELDAEAFAENGWEGGRVVVGDVVLRLLHPCKRCTIPTWAPGGRERDRELLQWFHREAAGTFGINARVEVAGELAVGAPVRVEPPA